jgi:hypothetical protein
MPTSQPKQYTPITSISLLRTVKGERKSSTDRLHKIGVLKSTGDAMFTSGRLLADIAIETTTGPIPISKIVNNV